MLRFRTSGGIFFIGTENFNSDVNVLVQAIAITVEILFKFLIAISK